VSLEERRPLHYATLDLLSSLAASTNFMRSRLPRFAVRRALDRSVVVEISALYEGQLLQ